MNRFFKWTLYILAGFAIVLFIAFKVLQAQTKKHSPEDTVVYVEEGNELSIFYNRPSKKGRVIFGSLLPFGEVWRTGANEATTFSTKKDITFGGKSLPAGNYTLWTIPGPDTWSVIINGKQYGWGVSFQGVASREAEADVVQVDALVDAISNTVELFTIAFEGSGSSPNLVLSWDQTKVTVPISW